MSSSTGKVDAFALMRAAQSSKAKPAAQPIDPDALDDDEDGGDKAAPAAAGKGKQAASKAAPVFKGSGLGAGPRHTVDPGTPPPFPTSRTRQRSAHTSAATANQPWVEK